MITIYTKDVDEDDYLQYEDGDYVSESIGGFVSVVRRINPVEKSFTEGHLWWKRTRTYTEYTHETIATVNKKNIYVIDYGDKK